MYAHIICCRPAVDLWYKLLKLLFMSMHGDDVKGEPDLNSRWSQEDWNLVPKGPRLCVVGKNEEDGSVTSLAIKQRANRQSVHRTRSAIGYKRPAIIIPQKWRDQTPRAMGLPG
jgi:hypothetical protein